MEKRIKYERFIIIMIIPILLMIGHPLLVREIISQVETPFIIRIGLVIMTYAFLIPFMLDLTEDLPYIYTKKDAILINVITAVFLSLSVIFLGFETWEELQLRHQLLQEGVSGVATVQECSATKYGRGGSSCHLEYEYEVRQANNTTKWYRVREKIPCSRECRTGYSVDITYLPHTPSKAGIEGNTYDLRLSVFALTACFNILFALLLKWRWDLKSWLRK